MKAPSQMHEQYLLTRGAQVVVAGVIGGLLKKPAGRTAGLKGAGKI